ncbi:MAG: TolC family protein [Planctomycetes bacterium]|nr:TolC family protein [Planctomycetota bacterium]
MTGKILTGVGAAVLVFAAGGCLTRVELPEPPRPSIAPEAAEPSTEGVALDPAGARPMYTELLPIDLASAVRVALAENLDVRRARERVAGSQARLDGSVAALFPVLSPWAMAENVGGAARATAGDIVSVAFESYQVWALFQSILNPGKVAYDIIASRKRLLASGHQERAVRMEVVRLAAVQYYDLSLARARVVAVERAVREAEELVRVTEARGRAGAGLPADGLRARAEYAARRQDLALALKAFGDASVALAVTLHLDPAVTLLPAEESLAPRPLVRADLEITALLDLALAHRDDLQAVFALVGAAEADGKSAWWAAFGPTTSAGALYGGLGGSAGVDDKESQGWHGQDRVMTGSSWKLALSSLADLESAGSNERLAALDAGQKLERVRAEVVRADQERLTQARLLPDAAEQLKFAEEALRTTRASFDAGATTAFDVLHAESVLGLARLRQGETVARFNQAQVNLLAALGLLDGVSLGTSVSRER